MSLALALLIVLASPQTTGTGTLEGTIVIHDSSRPAANARIVLSRRTTPQEAPGPLVETTANAAGRFAFKDLRPGQYTASSADYRFAYTSRGEYQQSVTIVAGQTARTSLTVGPKGSLRGRVLRPNGEPLTSGYVSAWRPMYVGPQILLRPDVTVNINQNGSYQLPYLDPGEYYLAAYDATQGRSYFPDSPNTSRAMPVTVIEDAESTADIVFRPDPPVKVSGRISAEIPNPENYEVTDFYMTRRNTRIRDDVPRLDYAATITGSPQKPERNVNVTVSDSGRQFEIQGVSAGSYDIFAILVEKPGPPAMTTQGTVAVLFPASRLLARTSVEVASVNVENVSLVGRLGVAVTGRVLWNPPEKAVSFNINLRAADNAPGAVMAVAGIAGTTPFTGPGQDGKFSFHNVAVGAYALNISGLPAGSYLSEIRQNGQNLGPTGLSVGTQPENSIEVVINDNAGTIRGSLQNQSAAGPGTDVVLVPEPPLRWNSNLYKTTRVNASRDFVLSNIAPGEYKLFAFEIAPRPPAESPEFVARYESRGLAILIQPGVTIDVQVPLISPP